MQNLNWQKAVIKVGSSLIAPDGQSCSAQYLLPIARFITASRAQGKQIILVSSGSAAAGRAFIQFHQTPSITAKQAMAAVGQSKMMANWMRFFDFACAQLLITHDDLSGRKRYVNIKNTLRELLKNQVLPIINENDTVATEELRVGDNDNLAAHVAQVADADLLIICSDVDGLFDKNPHQHPDAQLIETVESIDASTFALAGDTHHQLGTGGMVTKLEAASKATAQGITTVIVNGTKGEVFDQMILNQFSGTVFKAKSQSKNAKKTWLKNTLKPKGVITIDAGAVNAIVNQGASLLSKGISKVAGQFHAGDPVDLQDQADNILARGLSHYSSQELKKIKGLNSQEIIHVLGDCPSEVIIHRDELVIL